MNRKEKILEVLDALRIRDLHLSEKFSALAYTKAIKELKKKESITKLEDVDGVPGVGKKIREKIKMILEIGEYNTDASFIDDSFYKTLLEIHGIGPVKAKELLKQVSSLEELNKKKDTLLTKAQQLGLKYHSASKERIPRVEMEEHEKIIQKVEPSATIVGSYRRGLLTSGDIDILVVEDKYKEFIKKLKDINYIVDSLSEGKKKYMGYVILKGNLARRIDILATSKKEYPYALLYFTGSDTFNVAFRKYANKKGYTLNEHTMEPIPNKIIESERDIFDFFKLVWKEPSERVEEESIVEKKMVSLKELMKSKKTSV